MPSSSSVLECTELDLAPTMPYVIHCIYMHHVSVLCVGEDFSPALIEHVFEPGTETVDGLLFIQVVSKVALLAVTDYICTHHRQSHSSHIHFKN